MGKKKYLSLERLAEYHALNMGKIESGDAAVKSYVDEELKKKSDSTHAHADKYYEKSEIDSKLSGVNSSISTHTGNGDIHVTANDKTNWNNAFNHSTTAHAPSNAERNIVVGIQRNGTDVEVDSSRKVNIIVPTTAAEVGASEAGHNHDGAYDTKGAADSALAEAKSYTDGKVTNMATTTVVDNKISEHNTSSTAHNDIRDLISELNTKVTNFLDVDDATTDQLSEVLELINNNKGTLESLTTGKVNVSDIVDNLETASASKVLSANQGVALKALIDALEAVVEGKSDEGHGHSISDVSGLQSALDGKAGVNHGEHVTYSTATPEMDGTASAGSATTVARSDHKHPTDTSRASKSDFDSHTGNTTVHITATERTNWNAAKTHADSAHAPSDAQKNVIESIKVNGSVQTVTDKVVDITVPTKASDIGAANEEHGHAISEITDLQTTLNNAASAIGANTSSITALAGRTTALEEKVGEGFEEITSEEISALFNE